MPGKTTHINIRLSKAVFLGVITTIAISWASALLDDPKNGSFGQNYTEISGKWNLQLAQTYKSNSSILIKGFNEDNEWRYKYAFGWPCFAMQYEFAGIKTVTFKKTTGILFSSTTNPGDTRIYALPFKPIVSGFLINTLIYSAFWLLLLGLIKRVNWMYRMHFGKCPECGYDLKDDLKSGCPECGWNREENVETSKYRTRKMRS